MAYSEYNQWRGHTNLGVPKEHVAEYNAELKRRGVAAHYEPVPGSRLAVPVASSDQGRKDFIKAIGGVDYQE